MEKKKKSELLAGVVRPLAIVIHIVMSVTSYYGQTKQGQEENLEGETRPQHEGSRHLECPFPFAADNVARVSHHCTNTHTEAHTLAHILIVV